MKAVLLTFFLICCYALQSNGQTDPCHKSTEGKDFWFGYMENRWSFNPAPYVEVTVTSRVDADFTIAIGPSETPYGGPYHVSANSSTQVVIDWRQVAASGSQNIENKAVHITSTQMVNVYAMNFCTNSSEVSVIYPTSSLGNEYFTMCYDAHYVQQGNGRNSEFLIVGVQDNTTVEITPKVDMDLKPLSANMPFTITLNKGQLYQVQSNNYIIGSQGDLTGSYIRSDKPIALFSGSLATTIPSSSNNAWDHLYEQIPPIQSWGREFYTVPLMSRLQDRYRVLAAFDGTVVTVEGIGDIILNRGEMNEFVLFSNQPVRINSNKKILVAQFSQSNSVDASFTGGNGDPFMIILMPVSQTVNDVSFVAYSSPEIRKYFINVISRTDQINNVELDNLNIGSMFAPYNNRLYSYAQVPISAGPHRIRSTNPEGGFIATVYAFGGVEGFGYGVGFNLDIHIELGGDTIINGSRTLIICAKTDSTLSAGFGFDKYLWNTNDTTSSIKVTNPGNYSVTASIGECIVSDSVKVMVHGPVVNLGNDTTVCRPDTITLNAGAGFKSYLWSPFAFRTQTMSPPVSGTYSVQVSDKLGCTASGSINLTIAYKPKINPFQLDTLFCGTKSAVLPISADMGNYTLERTDNGTVFTGLNAVVPDWGTYPFKFTATDSTGCFADTTFRLGFHKIPVVDFSIDSITCYHYNLTARYIGDATVNAARFTWVFGGDTIADGIGIDSKTIPLGVNQSKRNLSLRVIEEGCSSANALKEIKVIPDLSVRIVDSLGCQPLNAEFIAVNSETVTYDWDFGDGTSGRFDSHPFHNYPNAGYYNVKLKVTTPLGCFNQILADSMVHVAPIPTVGFSLDPDECLNLGNHQVSYVGTGNQFDTYNWDLSAFDPVEIVQNPGTTQGPFVFNLKNKPQAPMSLSVVSTYGCKSDTAKITVKRIPDFSMNIYNNKGCIPLETGFEAIINDLVDQLFFTWDYGDGKTGSGDNTSHFYNIADKKYDITLTVMSALTKCSDTLKIDTLIHVYPKPTAGFSVDHSIVYNDKPDVVFDNQSVGSTNYIWNFGDGTTSIEENPLHKYQSIGHHNTLLQALNEYNCSDTISYDVLVAVARIFPPNAFSPNAPNPIDREFKLGQEAIKEEGYHLVIISRWNDIMFEAKNEIKGWNGRMKNGDYAPAGNYVWILDFTDFLNRRHRQTGTVTLVY